MKTCVSFLVVLVFTMYCNKLKYIHYILIFVQPPIFLDLFHKRECLREWHIRPLLSNGERKWQFLGMLHSRSPSVLSIDRVKEIFDAADSAAIFCDSVTVGVIMTKPSSSSVNSSSSSESPASTSSSLPIPCIVPVCT
jgi:hypothetical protein